MDTDQKKKESPKFNPIINSIFNKSWLTEDKSGKEVKRNEYNSELSSKRAS